MMANQVSCVTQNDRHVMEGHDTFMTNLVNSDNSRNTDDVTNVISVNNSDLGGGQQTQHDGISSDVRRLDDCGVSTTSEGRDLSCSNHGLPTKEQGARSARRYRYRLRMMEKIIEKIISGVILY